MTRAEIRRGGFTSVELRIRDRACPRGHHDQSPRWLGIRWAGVPRPIRWALGHEPVRVLLGLSPEAPMDREAREWRVGGRSGCGCIVRLKAAWTTLAGSAWARRGACAAVVGVAALLAAR